MNTATLRTMARASEGLCKWDDAAAYYEMAIKAYPGNIKSSLAQRDISMMQSKVDACRRML